MIVENLSALKINKLTREQYLAAKEAGTLNEKEFYLTPDIEGKDVANTNTVVWSDITIPVSSWVADHTYASYPYKATLDFPGCNDTYIPEVFPSVAAIESGFLAPIAVTKTNKIELFATSQPDVELSIAHIMLTKNKGSSFVGEDPKPEDIGNLQNSVSALQQNVSDLTTTVNSKASYSNYTITLGTSWGSDNTQTVTVNGILSTDSPIIDIICSSNYEKEQEEWGKIYRAQTINGGIKFYASEATTISLNLQVKVIK